MQPTLTAIIIAKNEQEMLPRCLNTLNWVDQTLVINNGSTDQTSKIAENKGAKVIHFEHSSFARMRNEALKHVETDWVFYIDADERVTPTLAKEIMVNLETQAGQVFSMKRKNICYGEQFQYGGWEDDEVTRVFLVEALDKWQGKVHETPLYKGNSILLHTPLTHLTHRSTQENLIKSAAWTKIEAELLHKSGIKKVNFFTILRKGFMEFIRRACVSKGYKDGLAGLIESLVQGINKMLVYIQVWELQQIPSLDEKYRRHEIVIQKQWENEKVVKPQSNKTKESKS
ncbi:MAG: UDP-glucose--lipopolysaccharide core heptose I 4-beta-glucosyltransferase, putative [Microgenomates bacterium 39_7]|nr:MAG: UDP-glucose--lipopolysaccharide core heptose I 4-beta-glucosyltransferase, putative [Microgenomates bacterium 39_7]